MRDNILRAADEEEEEEEDEEENTQHGREVYI